MDTQTIPDRTAEHNSDTSFEIGRFPKNRSEDLVLTLTRYHGHDLIDVRVHSVLPGVSGKHPTRKGVSINVALLPDLIAVLQRAESEARDRGLLVDAPAAKPKDRTAAARQRRRRDRLRMSRDRVRDTVTDVPDLGGTEEVSLFEQWEDRHPTS
jgi:hypothetical protein